MPIAHAFQALSIFRQGWTGVSFFCVISGFILTHIYIDRKISYGAFIKNRFLRIAPLYVVVVYLAFYVSDWDLLALTLTTLTGLSRGGLPSIAGAGWTVLIEFQFYLLFPFILVFHKKYGARYLAGLLVTSLLIKAAVWNATGTVQLIAYYSIFGRIDQFLIGIAAAVAIRNVSVQRWLGNAYVSAAVLLIGTAAALLLFRWFNAKGGLLNFDGNPWPSKSPVWVGMSAVEGVIYACITIGYLHIPAVRMASWLARAMAHLGKISYSIYLIHILTLASLYPLISRMGWTPTTFEQSLLVCVGVVMPCLAVAATLTYHFIELPFMNMRSSGSVAASQPAAVIVLNPVSHTRGT